MLSNTSMCGDKICFANLSLPIVNHCINACISCSTFSPVCTPYYVDVDTVERDLDAFTRIAHTIALSIIGGEPLLHPELLHIADIAVKSGVADTVQIVTNGQLLNQMSDEFWQKTPPLIVTRYPGKFTDVQFNELCSKAAKYNKSFTFTSPMYNSFSKSIAKKRHSDDEARNVFLRCWTKGWAVILIDGKFYWCHEFYYRHLLKLEHCNEGLDIATATVDSLKTYLSPTGPSSICYNCTGYLDRTQPWGECRDRDEWFRKSTNE